jgi:hypothetical protein
MWPVQTLTLLLCLTDEEQLFAQGLPIMDEPPAVEVVIPEKGMDEGDEQDAYPLLPLS